jgi:phosphoserine phosphatase
MLLRRLIKSSDLEQWKKSGGTKKGHKVVIVSAFIECWLKKWCDKINLITTRLEIQEGKITGKFATKNCYGIEKVNRIKERYDLS